MRNQLIIGLTGHPSSGKDSVASYLVTKGFTNISLGDIVRDYVSEHNLGDHSRDNLRKTAGFLRTQYGPGFLAEEALKKVSSNTVLSGVRALGEAKVLVQREIPIIAITASIEKRYLWARTRGRIAEDIPFKEFKRLEDNEAASPLSHEMNVNGVIEMADYKIENDGTLDDLYKKVDVILQKIEN